MEHNNETKKTIWQIVKFAIVGVLNTLVDFAVFQALNLLLGWVYLAQVIGYTCGIVNSYLWNSNWTFREQRTRSFREIALFVVVNLASLGVSLGVIWLCRDVLGMTNEWAAGWMPAVLSGFIKGDTVDKLIATFFAIVVNYLGNRLFVFKKKPVVVSQEASSEIR
ncbi:MAG: GtrA family protein [Eubacteriales bacterium]|nr:GtrA family protein [Eubacteriales bacterium]